MIILLIRKLRVWKVGVSRWVWGGLGGTFRGRLPSVLVHAADRHVVHMPFPRSAGSGVPCVCGRWRCEFLRVAWTEARGGAAGGGCLAEASLPCTFSSRCCGSRDGAGSRSSPHPHVAPGVSCPSPRVRCRRRPAVQGCRVPPGARPVLGLVLGLALGPVGVFPWGPRVHHGRRPCRHQREARRSRSDPSPSHMGPMGASSAARWRVALRSPPARPATPRAAFPPRPPLSFSSCPKDTLSSVDWRSFGGQSGGSEWP